MLRCRLALSTQPALWGRGCLGMANPLPSHPNFDFGARRKSKVLCDPVLSKLLLEANEENHGGAFSHWSKFQILIQKGKSPDGIRWCFIAV